MSEVFVQIGKRGTMVIPARIRKELGIVDGSMVVVTETGGAIEIRPAKLVAAGDDARMKIAKRILSGAEDLGEYLAAIEEVRRMGFEPDEVPHERYSGG